MPHGGPDWGTEGPIGTVYTIQDMGELAARLGSIVIFDRRGNVLWFDDFESGIEKWEVIGPGAIRKAEWSSEASRAGGFSAKLTTGNVRFDYIAFERRMPYPVLSRIAFEISFTLDDDVDRIEQYLILYDGTTSYVPHIRYSKADKKLYYRDDRNRYILLKDNYDLFSSDYLFHTFKLVVDFITMKYSYLLVDSDKFDLSEYALFDSGIALLPQLWISLDVYTNVNASISIYADGAIVTQNEP